MTSGIAFEVKARREKANFSMAELSVRANLSLGYISKLESGAMLSPRYSNLRAIAQALECTLADLTGEQGEKVSGMTGDEVVDTAADSVEEGIDIWSRNHPDIRMTKDEWDDLREVLIIEVCAAFARALGMAMLCDGVMDRVKYERQRRGQACSHRAGD